VTKVTSVRTVRTRADGGWTIVKIETVQPGLHGIGSASDQYDPADVEDIWQTLLASGYWRNGAASNTALGGIDTALGDIRGKEAAGGPVPARLVRWRRVRARRARPSAGGQDSRVPFDDDAYLEAVPAMFAALRDRCGAGVTRSASGQGTGLGQDPSPERRRGVRPPRESRGGHWVHRLVAGSGR